MSRTYVVTDSTAYLPEEIREQLEIRVVPLRVRVGNREYLDGVDISPEEYLAYLNDGSVPLQTLPPKVEEIRQVYEELNQITDQIVSIHVSAHLNPTYEHAREAANALLGRCRIAVIDSQTVSLGLGTLVEEAAKAAAQGDSMREIIHRIHGMIPRIYVVFFSDSLEYLERSGRVARAQAILGSMLGIKPFLIIEDGDIVPMEKVRDRERAVEKLIDFVAEFDVVERMAILHGHIQPTPEVLSLRDRLKELFPDTPLPILPYGPALADHVGPNSVGIVVYEGLDLEY